MELSYFDEYIDRTEKSRSYSTKWIALNRRYPEFDHTDVIPMWIADMDFRCPPEVIEAVEKRAEHGIYGYTDQILVKDFLMAAAEWAGRRYGWKPDPKWGVFTPGVLLTVTAAVQEFTNPGDGVIIQPPVYYPFKDIIKNNQRVVRENLLKYKDGYYQIDFENLERLAKDPGTKLLLFCNPHNPVGRVWKKEELKQVTDICRRNGLLLVSDEIHADFILRGSVHTPVAVADGNISENLIACYAPSKTFNLAGLGAAAAFAPNEEIRKRLIRRIAANRIPASNVFGPLAGYVAYTQCEEYANTLAKYIENNIAYVRERIHLMDGISMCRSEGTYFAWLDMNGLNLTTEELYTFLYEKAGLATDFGTWFGSGGEGFARLNLACPMSVVKKAMDQLEQAVKSGL